MSLKIETKRFIDNAKRYVDSLPAPVAEPLPQNETRAKNAIATRKKKYGESTMSKKATLKAKAKR